MLLKNLQNLFLYLKQDLLFCKLNCFCRKKNVDIYLVGGQIRDLLLGINALDYDFVVSQNPIEFAKEFADETNGYLVILNDQMHPTARVVYKDRNLNIDITQLRGNIDEDLLSRDFTINSIAIDAKSDTFKLYDPTGGLNDIKRKRIRIVHPNALKEDALRCLRAIRFSSQLNFKITPTTLEAIQEAAHLIKLIAPERINYELSLIFKCPNSADSIKILNDVGLLSHILPEVTSLSKIITNEEKKTTLLDHSLDTLRQLEWIIKEDTLFLEYKDSIYKYLNQDIGQRSYLVLLKLSCLLHDIGKPKTYSIEGGKVHFINHEVVGAEMSGEVGVRLRFSRRQTKILQELVKYHMRPGYLTCAQRFTEKAILRLYRALGENYIGILLLSLADHYATPTLSTHEKHLKTIQLLLSKYYEYESRTTQEPLVNGHDLISQFNLSPSPLIGDLLERVKFAQLEGKIKNKTEALSFVANLLKSNPNLVSKGSQLHS